MRMRERGVFCFVVSESEMMSFGGGMGNEFVRVISECAGVKLVLRLACWYLLFFGHPPIMVDK